MRENGNTVSAMRYRSAFAAALLLAALATAHAEPSTRMSFSLSKSFHPGSDREYSTTHPGIGVTVPLAGQWLRGRTGVVRHSHTRWGPVAGASAAWSVTKSVRLGLSGGFVGNYAHGHWWRRGVVPIVQWYRSGGLVWEFTVARAERVTFVGVALEVPLSVLGAM